MCTGIALPLDDLPAEFHDLPEVARRVHLRAGILREVRFEWWQSPAVLPVRWGGRLRLIPWGSKRRGSPLPPGGWLTADDAAAAFAGARPEPVVIPAVMGVHAAAWYGIDVGIRGVVVRTRAGPVVYMLVERPTKYYRNMAQQADLEPMFVNQVI